MTYADSLRASLEEVARRAADAEGVSVEWVELKRKGGSLLLRVFIDRPGATGLVRGEGVTLEDCERVSRRLGLLLDEEDPIASSYTLEVSSPGLDRPLWRESDYRRFIGRLARVQTKEPVSGRRRFTGRIRGLGDGDVELGSEVGRSVRIPLEKIERARLEVELPSSREGES